MAGVALEHGSSDDSGHSAGQNMHYGKVNYFNPEKGFGFLHVSGHPTDVFFHIHTITRDIGITNVQKGDSLLFDTIRKNKNKDGSSKDLKHSAQGFKKLMKAQYNAPGKENKSEPQQSLSNKAYHHGNSGSCIARAPPRFPIYEVTSQNGEVVAKDVNRENHKSKSAICSIAGPGRMKIGAPCVVPNRARGPTLVSATGPNSADVSSGPILESPEITKLRESIGRKKSVMRSIKLDKLPDGGRRLRDEIKAMELQLKTLSVASHTQSQEKTQQEALKPSQQYLGKNVQNGGKSQASSLSTNHHEKTSWGAASAPQASFKALAHKAGVDGKTQPKSEPLGTKMCQMTLDRFDMGPMCFPDEPLYGGRMTSSRLTEVRQITKSAIEALHKSLETRPEPAEEYSDPRGLLVTLMQHQRQALAWLVWRESQMLAGGILADDMGLGKTLTMISLILVQRENEEKIKSEKCDVKEEEKNEDFDKSTELNDSDVIVIEDDDSKCVKKESGKGGSDESSLVESSSTLIVAPASLLFHWEKEIRNRCKKGLLSIHLFHGTSREKDPGRLAEFDVVITTYDILRRSKSAGRKAGDANKSVDDKDGPLMQIKWRRVILDEAHQIKNFKSLSSEASCQLEAKARWALSGTPVQNNLTDMYAVLKFLHCRPFDEYKVWKHQVDNKSPKGQERLKTLVSCIVLRREKSQSGLNGKPLVNLPKRTFVTHKLKLNDVEKEVYEKLQSESQDAFRKFQAKKKQTAERNAIKARNLPAQPSTKTQSSDSAQMTATVLLVMLLRLRQCCGHLSLLKESFDPELLSNEKKEMALEDMFQSMDINKTPVKMADISVSKYKTEDKAKYFEKSYCSGKVEFVMDELNKLRFERPDDKCVVVSQWTSMLEVVAHHLDKVEISYVAIKGNVSAKRRMDMVDEFNRNPVRPKVILLSLQAGGVGLNLIGGNHLYLLDMHWNPALECQAFDRIYRVGQTKPVFVHKFVVEDTVEERILKLQEHKLSIAKAVMEGAGVEDRKKLSLQDMKLLFGI